LQHWQRYIHDSTINKTILEPMIVARTHGLKSLAQGPYTAQTGSPSSQGLFDNVGHFASLLDMGL